MQTMWKCSNKVYFRSTLLQVAIPLPIVCVVVELQRVRPSKGGLSQLFFGILGFGAHFLFTTSFSFVLDCGLSTIGSGCCIDIVLMIDKSSCCASISFLVGMTEPKKEVNYNNYIVNDQLMK